jgi:hypothetical protein
MKQVVEFISKNADKINSVYVKKKYPLDKFTYITFIGKDTLILYKEFMIRIDSVLYEILHYLDNTANLDYVTIENMIFEYKLNRCPKLNLFNSLLTNIESSSLNYIYISSFSKVNVFSSSVKTIVLETPYKFKTNIPNTVENIIFYDQNIITELDILNDYTGKITTYDEELYNKLKDNYNVELKK